MIRLWEIKCRRVWGRESLRSFKGHRFAYRGMSETSFRRDRQHRFDPSRYRDGPDRGRRSSSPGASPEVLPSGTTLEITEVSELVDPGDSWFIEGIVRNDYIGTLPYSSLRVAFEGEMVGGGFDTIDLGSLDASGEESFTFWGTADETPGRTHTVDVRAQTRGITWSTADSQTVQIQIDQEETDPSDPSDPGGDNGDSGNGTDPGDGDSDDSIMDLWDQMSSTEKAAVAGGGLVLGYTLLSSGDDAQPVRRR